MKKNIYEQQAANKRTTLLVMGMFTALVALLGYGVDTALLGAPFPIATLFSLVVGAGSSWWSLRSGAQAIINASGAVTLPQSDRYRILRNVTEEMAIASGLPRPRLHVIPDPDPNAFATGRNPSDSHIVVTEGLLDSLNREELQGVIAHEMAHIRNLDIRLMTVVATLIGAVVLLAELGRRTMLFGRGGRRRNSGSPIILIVWIIGLILAPLISRILAMAVSRQREYLADATGAELTRNPGALASALEKIDAAVAPTRSIKRGTAHLCIADPLGREVNVKEGALADLFATHPPISKRIALLRAMAYGSRE